ncbi:hypothetical protein [Fonticella tunisiensis]|uniref:Uncharacterized protein n=1 Tax=Fonticella tunisiensis TaxID=1096341 RepID=A0A4R7KU76_9CLOT|nr:hypothetical protein [Fonticella tunisiensis]TDT62800.1 hypothetical protein EDD71_10373 [Fonticella tunisiensis]
MCKLWDRKDKYGSELSKWMMQKVSICSCLITQLKIILINEPVIGLGPKTIKITKNINIRTQGKGCIHTYKYASSGFGSGFVRQDTHYEGWKNSLHPRQE